MSKKKHVGIALQGGGSHGAFTWGVLDRLLEEDDLIAEGMCGTSAGAVNAVTCAYGLHLGGPAKAKELMEQLWRRIAQSGTFLFKPGLFDKTYSNGDLLNSAGYMMFNAMTQFLSPYNFNPFNYNPLRDILNDLIDFEDLHLYNKKKLFICATNVKTNRAKIFTNPEITVDAVLASACLPFLFQAVQIDGEYYWDGGYMGNPPISPLITNTDVHDILLVKINSINIHSVPTTARDIADRVNEISFNSSLINEMKLIHYRNQLIRNGVLTSDGKENREIFVHTISGYEALSELSQSSKMNTSWDFLLQLKAKGREVADNWIKGDFNQVGLKSTFDVEEHFFGKF
ncbi:MAG: patatin-like phospholipase family protein [Sphingobacteriia bacterium]|jgi:NTE family protein|nr:patatin-like phospholipase family protein [Sphingobacteriia bacterium]